MAGPASRSKLLFIIRITWQLVIVYQSTVIIPVFGVVEIIAHFKVGMQDWIHIALVSKNVQVSRKASMIFLFWMIKWRVLIWFLLDCGDKYCDLHYENCSNCPIDCGKCPLKPFQIGLISTVCVLVLASLISFGLVSWIIVQLFSYLLISILKFKNKDSYGIQVGLSM
jgi:hypothetical protein